MENKELNLNEMEAVSGGKGGSKTPLPKKDGFVVHQITGSDRLWKLAKANGVTVDYLVSINPTITNPNDITTGYYMYLPTHG